MVLFDKHRAVVRSMSESVGVASADRLQELVALLVERVDPAGRHVSRVVWTPAARKFFADIAQECAGMAPPAGFEPATPALGRRRSIH